jgi:hypothetical protein
MKNFDLPRISGSIEPGKLEQFFIDFPLANSIKNALWNSGEFIWNFVSKNAAFILLILTIVGISVVIFKKLKARRNYVKKLWQYNLFFLSKRQMMLPLVSTLAKRDNQLVEESVIKKLLKIRNECRDISLKTNPQERLKKESEISKILFDYFEKCEKTGRLKQNPKFKKIVSDLEFIDSKLVQLQKIYNEETKKWNSIVEFPIIKLFFYLFGFRSFRCFNI